jgi:hypothetical protein
MTRVNPYAASRTVPAVCPARAQVLRQLLEDKVVTTSRAPNSQASPRIRNFCAGLHPQPKDAMTGLTMPLCSDDTVLCRASSARGYARVLLDMKCRSGVVVHSRAAVFHTVRRFGLAFRLHYDLAKYLSKKLHGCPCGYYGEPEDMSAGQCRMRSPISLAGRSGLLTKAISCQEEMASIRSRR